MYFAVLYFWHNRVLATFVQRDVGLLFFDPCLIHERSISPCCTFYFISIRTPIHRKIFKRDRGTYASNSYPLSYRATGCVVMSHDDVIKWDNFPRYWPFMRGIHRDKGWWLGALMFSLICAWTNGCTNNRDAGDSRPHRAHYDVTVMKCMLSMKQWMTGDVSCTHCLKSFVVITMFSPPLSLSKYVDV